MVKVCKHCGYFISPVYGEWWDEYDMAECYDEDTNYNGQHEPLEIWAGSPDDDYRLSN